VQRSGVLGVAITAGTHPAMKPPCVLPVSAVKEPQRKHLACRSAGDVKAVVGTACRGRQRFPAVCRTRRLQQRKLGSGSEMAHPEVVKSVVRAASTASA